MISPFHPRPSSSLSRRHLLRAGAAGVPALYGSRVLAGSTASAASSAKSVIFLFLTGGASQHDTFDMKPAATDTIRGEFHPIATNTPGTHICEHMPRLAQRSHLWSLCRSLSHTHSGHVGVIATQVTFQGELFGSLVERFAQGVTVHTQVCPGFVEQVEAGKLDGEETLALARRYLAPLIEAGVDTLVLGCTHYAFLRPVLARVVGDEVEIVDPAPAVARQTGRVLARARPDYS